MNRLRHNFLPVVLLLLSTSKAARVHAFNPAVHALPHPWSSRRLRPPATLLQLWRYRMNGVLFHPVLFVVSFAAFVFKSVNDRDFTVLSCIFLFVLCFISTAFSHSRFFLALVLNFLFQLVLLHCTLCSSFKLKKRDISASS